MCLSINDTDESIISKLKIVVICVVLLVIVLVAIKYGTQGESDATGLFTLIVDCFIGFIKESPICAGELNDSN